MKNINKHINELSLLFKKELCKLNKIYKINSPRDKAVNNIINISFDGINGEVLQLLLSTKNIYVSTLSACNSGHNNLSHVLLSMGVEEKIASESIRISFGKYNSKEEIYELINFLQNI